MTAAVTSTEPATKAPARRWRFVPLGCALGCGTSALILAGAVVMLVLEECPGEVARWTNRPEGRVVVRPGMTRQQVQQEATVRIGKYGDSGRFVEFEIAEGIRFSGIELFVIDAGADGRVSYVSMISANESWPILWKAASATEEHLLANGWAAAPGQPSVRSLTRNPREAAERVTDSGAIAQADFVYTKKDQKFRLAAGGLWSGIPWWRGAHQARVFWRNMNYFPLGDPNVAPTTDASSRKPGMRPELVAPLLPARW